MELVRLYPRRMFADNYHPSRVTQKDVAPVHQLHSDIDRLFEQAVHGLWEPWNVAKTEENFMPTLDVQGDDQRYLVNVEVPGVEKDAIKLSVQEGVLVISGEKKEELVKEQKEKGFYHCERSYGSFQRALTLPEDADVEAIAAHCKNGVLTVTIPRKAEQKSSIREIPIEKPA